MSDKNDPQADTRGQNPEGEVRPCKSISPGVVKKPNHQNLASRLPSLAYKPLSLKIIRASLKPTNSQPVKQTQAFSPFKRFRLPNVISHSPNKLPLPKTRPKIRKVPKNGQTRFPFPESKICFLLPKPKLDHFVLDAVYRFANAVCQIFLKVRSADSFKDEFDHFTRVVQKVKFLRLVKVINHPEAENCFKVSIASIWVFGGLLLSTITFRQRLISVFVIMKRILANCISLIMHVMKRVPADPKHKVR